MKQFRSYLFILPSRSITIEQIKYKTHFIKKKVLEEAKQRKKSTMLLYKVNYFNELKGIRKDLYLVVRNKNLII